MNALVTSNPVINKSASNNRPVSTVFTLNNSLCKEDVLSYLGEINQEIEKREAFVGGTTKIRRISEAGIEVKVQAYCKDHERFNVHKNALLAAINEVIPAGAWPPADINVFLVRND